MLMFNKKIKNQKKMEQNKEIEEIESTLAENIAKYLNQLSPIEIKAYNIAKNHLGSSFNIAKSNGFIAWLSQS
jgi:hypothetical protein